MQNYVVEVNCGIIKVYNTVLIHYDYFTLSGAVKYCNQRVCLFTCISQKHSKSQEIFPTCYL